MDWNILLESKEELEKYRSAWRTTILHDLAEHIRAYKIISMHVKPRNTEKTSRTAEKASRSQELQKNTKKYRKSFIIALHANRKQLHNTVGSRKYLKSLK